MNGSMKSDQMKQIKADPMPAAVPSRASKAILGPRTMGHCDLLQKRSNQAKAVLALGLSILSPLFLSFPIIRCLLKGEGKRKQLGAAVPA